MTEPNARGGGGRLVSLDAYRGFVMLAMASAGFAVGEVARDFPDSYIWHALDTQTEHAIWRGCSLWDLIQPSFMFIVGVAMPFSHAARQERGDGFVRQFPHALWRSVALVALGLFLSSAWSKQTEFSFAIVLCQIGIGYPVVFLLTGRSWRTQLAVGFLILFAYWLWFALTPIPGPRSGPVDIGGSSGEGVLPGFLGHWSKHSNPAAVFDRWFLNLLPRAAGSPFRVNAGGYTTLNFVPSIATMLFGVVAGGLLRSDVSGRAKIQTLLIAAALGIAAGSMLDATVCPIVKRIWTPAWVVYSTGWTCGLLAVFYGLIDVAGWRRWTFPLVVVGVNSIAFYVMAQLMKPWVASQLTIHLTTALQVARSTRDRLGLTLGGLAIPAKPFQGQYGPIAQSAAVLLVLWLIALWMYRRKIFLRL
jgi:heparan-alpha-glucosaminide N-acetyltransferase